MLVQRCATPPDPIIFFEKAACGRYTRSFAVFNNETPQCPRHAALHTWNQRVLSAHALVMILLSSACVTQSKHTWHIDQHFTYTVGSAPFSSVAVDRRCVLQLVHTYRRAQSVARAYSTRVELNPIALYITDIS